MSTRTRSFAPVAAVALAATLAFSAASATSVAWAEEQVAGGAAQSELQATHVIADSGRYSVLNTKLSIGGEEITTTDTILVSDGHYMSVNLRVDFASNNYKYVYQGSATPPETPLDDQGYPRDGVIIGELSSMRSATGSNMLYENIDIDGLNESKTLWFYNTNAGGSWEEATIAFTNDNLSVSETAWSRLYGTTALGTMTKISIEGWDSSEYVIIASIDGYWDALSASALAGLCNAPILLTDSSSLSEETAQEIVRLGASKAYIVGGTDAVSDSVRDSIRDLSVEVRRLAGDTAIETAEEISNEVVGWNYSKTCVLCTVNGFYDALSVAPIAYSQGYPVYLTQTDSLDPSTYADIVADYDKVYVIGGTAAVSDNVIAQLTNAGLFVTRIAGDNAWQTSALVAGWGINSLNLSVDNIGVADGNGYWDALTGAALCGKAGSVIVLVPHDGTTSEGDTFTYNPYTIDNIIIPNKVDIFNGYVFGGTSAVPASTFAYIEGSTY